MAVNFPSSAPGEFIGQPGYPDASIPYYGANLHIDGIWSGGCAPPQTRELGDAQRESWYRRVGTNGEHWTAAMCDAQDVRKAHEAVARRYNEAGCGDGRGDGGRNSKVNVNVANHFTLLVGVPLSDMLQEGTGNLAVLPGGHEACARVFRASALVNDIS